MKINVHKITQYQKLIIAKGLCDYQYIMDNWEKNDDDFQKVYYDFYMKARPTMRKSGNNKDYYFQKLQSISPDDDITEIIKDLQEKIDSKSYEFSLVSKMIHTRNPLCPIYDSKVREYLSKEENVIFWVKKSGASRGTDILEKIKHDYRELCNWYEEFMKDRGKEWIKWFNEEFPSYTHISDIKKIDFIIFATN